MKNILINFNGQLTVLIMIIFLFSISGTLFAKINHNVKYQIDGKAYEGYYIAGKKGAPFVLIIHDWDGLTDYEIKRAHMLSGLGYSVFAADLFGTGIRPVKVEDKKQLTNELYKDRLKMRKLIYGALNEAEKMGADLKNAVAIGYCFGGTAALELARSGADIKGFVVFHGGLSTPEGQDYSKIKGEILLFHGSSDNFVPIEQFASLVKEFEAANVKNEMITYGGADHAFSVFGGERYNEEADKKSWDRFLEFLEKKLKK